MLVLESSCYGDWVGCETRLRSAYALTRKGVVLSQDFVVFSKAPLNGSSALSRFY